MRHDNIIDALEFKCPFPEQLNNNNIPNDDMQVGYIRADYDGHRWWNTIWPKRNELATPEICKEIDAVYAALISDEFLVDLEALRSFCSSHPNAQNTDDVDKFNFYLESKHCWYWLLLITRNKDYNLYLHAYPNTGDKLKDYYSFLDTETPRWTIEMQITLLNARFPELSESKAMEIVLRWQFRFIPKETIGANDLKE